MITANLNNPILLDTCTLLWLTMDQNKLSGSAKKIIRANANKLFVSAISAFEIGIKHAKGKLELPLTPQEWFAKAVELHGLIEVPINSDIAAIATALPKIHDDPCDRFIIATSQAHELVILSPDQHFRNYPNTTTIWD